MTEATQLCDTSNLLHPRQISEFKEIKAKLEGMLSQPGYVRDQLADGGSAVFEQLKGLDKMLEQAPKPIPAEQIDDAVKMEVHLREAWLHGMPTQAEMRRNPTGATDKNTAWNDRVKLDVLRWKHLRRRLHASGISEHRLANESDISNIEMYRPAGGPQELNMHNEQIPGADIYLPPPGVGPVAVMSDDDRETLQTINPELADKMATLSNEDRSQVLELVRRMNELQEAPKPEPKQARVKGKKHAGPLSDAEIARRAKLSARMQAANQARRAAKMQEA